MPSPTSQCAPGASNCGLGPLRYSVPLSSRGNSPVTFRNGASHSIGIGARLVRAALVETWSSISRLLRLYLYIVKISVTTMPGAVKQNLYSVKMASYKDSHGKIIQRKQNGPPRGEGPPACKARSRTAGRPAPPCVGRYPLSSWRPARGVVTGGRARARARRTGRTDAAGGGARGRRLACRADPSFRRPDGPPERTRRDRLPQVQYRHD